MANKKISELQSRTPALSDLMLVGDPSSGYSYKCTVTALATIIETDIADGYVTIGTTQTISGAKTFSNNLTLTSVANAATTQSKFLTLNGSNVVNYRTGAEVLSDIGGQASLSGTGLVKSTSGTISYITDNSSNWNTAYNDSIVSAAVSGTTTKTLTLTQQDGGTLTASWSDLNTDAVTSVFGRTGAVVATEGDYSLNLLSDVTLTSPSNGQVLKYNGTAWVNDTDANTGTVTSVAATGGTGISVSGSPITSSGTLIITNTAPDQTVVLTAGTGISVSGTYPNFTITNSSPSSGGTVTSVGLSSATSGVTIGSTPITTSGTITLAIATASGTQQGLLSSTDWTTFNNKQNAITLTTTGTSGAATLVGSTLNIPQYQAALTNPVTGTGTTNYIPKFTSSSAIGNSQIFDNGSAVGIGTATPEVTLAVYNASTPKIHLQNSTSGVTDVDGFQLAFSSSDGYIWNFENGGIRFATNNTERMRLDASGNFLVGGTSDALTDVNRKVISLNGTSDAIISLRYGGSLNGFIWGNGATAFQIASNNLPIVFSNGNAGGTERMRLDASGNLGLGTSAPSASYKFTISGTDAVFPGLYLNNTTNSKDYSLFVGGTSLIIRDVTSTTNRLFLDASGNLGLGVTPSAWSVLRGLQNGRANLVGYVSNAEGAWLTNNAFYNGTSWTYQTSAQATMYQQLSGVQSWHIAGSGTAGTAISFTQAMTLDASGNLGIGSTSPSNRLQITAAAGSSHARWTESATTVGFVGGAQGIITGLNGSFAVRGESGLVLSGAGNAANLYINSSGNVGIGTTSPGEKLEIYGSAAATSNFTALKLTNGSDGGLKILFSNSVSSELASIVAGVTSAGVGTDDGTLIFSTATNAVSTERMRITSGGELLINTTSDAGDYKLQVAGNVYAGGNFVSQGTGTSQFIMNANSGTYSASINTGGTGNGLGYTTGQLYFGVDNNVIAFANKSSLGESMRITSSGELLINTTSDAGDYKLQVNGNGYFTGAEGNVYINSSSGSGKNWQLQSFSDGKLYINVSGVFSALGLDGTTGAATFSSSIKTAAPSGGNAAAWKLGERVASSSLTLNTTQYIQLDINGTLYTLATVNLS